MAKTDFKTDRKDLYAPPAGRFVEVTVPAMTFVAIDGHGDPNTLVRMIDAVGRADFEAGAHVELDLAVGRGSRTAESGPDDRRG